MLEKLKPLLFLLLLFSKLMERQLIANFLINQFIVSVSFQAENVKALQICCFSLFALKQTEEYFGFGLLVRQKKKFKDATLGSGKL